MSVKVMVMDDSPFSRMMISETLYENGYEVVGEYTNTIPVDLLIDKHLLI